MTLMVLSDVVRIPAEAKIQLPVQRKGVIKRAKLLERLTAVPDDVPLVLLTAPAGYGKTTLLSQWAAADGWRFGWVTLDQEDNDPVRLIDHVALALDGMGALDRREILASPAFRTPPAGDAPPYLAALPYALASLCLGSHPGVLVVDDVHELVNVEAMDFIRALGAAVPPGFHVALGARHSWRLGLARSRGEGCVEFGVDDLAFTEDETRQVLAGAGVACSDQQAALLVQRTGGSPAAVHLSAIGAELSDDLHLHVQAGG